MAVFVHLQLMKVVYAETDLRRGCGHVPHFSGRGRQIANRVMCANLRSNGYEASAAFDGGGALEVLDREHIDLMIADVMMPGMYGYELTRLIRDSGGNLPILMVTAKDRQEDKHRGFLVGTDDCMTKPVDMTELLYRVKALLRRAKIVEEQ